MLQVLLLCGLLWEMQRGRAASRLPRTNDSIHGGMRLLELSFTTCARSMTPQRMRILRRQLVDGCAFQMYHSKLQVELFLASDARWQLQSVTRCHQSRL